MPSASSLRSPPPPMPRTSIESPTITPSGAGRSRTSKTRRRPPTPPAGSLARRQNDRPDRPAGIDRPRHSERHRLASTPAARRINVHQREQRRRPSEAPPKSPANRPLRPQRGNRPRRVIQQRHIGIPEPIDRLLPVADENSDGGSGASWTRPKPSPQEATTARPVPLHAAGVLELVDEHVPCMAIRGDTGSARTRRSDEGDRRCDRDASKSSTSCSASVRRYSRSVTANMRWMLWASITSRSRVHALSVCFIRGRDCLHRVAVAFPARLRRGVIPCRSRP